MNGDKMVVYKDGNQAITSLAGDDQSSTIMAGTHSQHFIHYKINPSPDKLKI